MNDTGTFMTRCKTAVSPRKRTGSSFAKRSKTAMSPNRASTSLGRRKQHYIVRDLTRFGADAPSWTIGGSRRPDKPPPDFPSPDHYDVPLNPCYKKLSHTIQERELMDYRTITSDIDFIDRKEITNVKNATIGSLDGTSFIPKSHSPAPSYHPDDYKPKHNYKQHVIEKKYAPEKRDVIPSPQDYHPTDINRPNTPCYSLPRAPIKRFSDEIKSEVPGPGSYNVGPQVKRAPRWSERLRVMPNKYKRPDKIVIKPWEQGNLQG